MLRQHLFDKRAPADPLFRWRGGDVSRLEGLSDAVFALALTMMIVSVGGGTTFSDIYQTFIDIPAYAASFTMLIFLWYCHYNFFRRYGLEDVVTILLNLVLLFLVLFYALPLQFLPMMLWKFILGDQAALEAMFLIDGEWITTALGTPDASLLIIYSAGYVGIFAVFLLMTARAYALRDQLELDKLEVLLTRGTLLQHVTMVAVGILSIVVVVITGSGMWGGFCYFLLWPLQMGFGMRIGRHAKRLRLELADES